MGANTVAVTPSSASTGTASSPTLRYASSNVTASTRPPASPFAAAVNVSGRYPRSRNQRTWSASLPGLSEMSSGQSSLTPW